MKFKLILSTFIILISLASACSLSTKPTEKSNLVFTAAAETVSVQLTQHAERNNAVPTITPTLPATSTSTIPPIMPSPSPTTTFITDTPPPRPNNSIACNQVGFVSDVTIPDGSMINPGSSFTKTWRLINAGTCAWTTAYSLVYTGGDRLGGLDSVPLTRGVAPGAMIDLSIDLKAPDKLGEYTSFFRLSNQNGERFGIRPNNSPFWVKIIVRSITTTPTLTPPTATLTASTPTPVPSISPTDITSTPIPPTPTLEPIYTPTNSETKKP